MFGIVLNTLLQNIYDLSILYYFHETLHLRCVAGLLIHFFEKYKDLVTIIIRECKKIARGFMEYLLLVHRPNKFQGILLTH